MAAGGIPPLVEVLASGTTSQAEKAAYVLENLATEEGNAEAMVTAGIEAALVSRFDLNFEDGMPFLCLFGLLDCYCVLTNHQNGLCPRHKFGKESRHSVFSSLALMLLL